VAGLAQVVDYLTGLRFTQAQCDHLRSRSLFSEATITRLSTLRFSGDRERCARAPGFPRRCSAPPTHSSAA